ncbi:hypothetical protein L6164_012578 [Bauhinia variegata]|uniref:Uncharacterized protein n=1 Tax=Bauhinia variegata TaxID=167791 RepID=A0ACB9PFN8_BAUVA|nr:hypothetical protein L6164_012578 [Bauhinia variegata]
MIRRCPRLLLCNPVKTITPKIEFFQSKVASSSDIATIVKVSPWILRRSLKNCLIPCYDFLRGYHHSDKKTITSIRRCPNMLRSDKIIQNVKCLVEIGLPESGIARLLHCWPRSLAFNVVKFKMAIKKVEDLGFDPSRYSFAPVFYALTVISKSTM